MPVEPNMHDDADLAKIRANQTDPLFMYLIVRKSLNMGVGKIGSQCGHAAQIVVINYYERLLARIVDQLQDKNEFEFDEPDKIMQTWFKESFRKSVLVADDKDWEKLKVEPSLRCFVVRDAGLTEVEPGSETVMALWPMRKSEVPKLVKRLQTLKAEVKEPTFREMWGQPVTFREAWKLKEAEGYNYGEDALERVWYGWELRRKQTDSAETFEEAWAKTGSQYGRLQLIQVKFGWEIYEEANRDTK